MVEDSAAGAVDAFYEQIVASFVISPANAIWQVFEFELVEWVLEVGGWLAEECLGLGSDGFG